MTSIGTAGQGRQVQGQQVLPGMPARLYPCTPSRLTTWLDCPRRYRFTYLDRPQPAKGPAVGAPQPGCGGAHCPGPLVEPALPPPSARSRA